MCLRRLKKTVMTLSTNIAVGIAETISGTSGVTSKRSATVLASDNCSIFNFLFIVIRKTIGEKDLRGTPSDMDSHLYVLALQQGMGKRNSPDESVPSQHYLTTSVRY